MPFSVVDQISYRFFSTIGIEINSSFIVCRKFENIFSSSRGFEPPGKVDGILSINVRDFPGSNS